MGTAERRYEIMKTLCRRRYETIRNLASEFGVSMRTVQRDIEVLSRTEPIYTQFGKYGGGVYVVESYAMDQMYLKEEELDVLQKLYIAADEQHFLLTDDEKDLLKSVLSEKVKGNDLILVNEIKYEKPQTKLAVEMLKIIKKTKYME